MNTEKRLEAIEKEIEKVKQRNLRVEDDKAWETSTFRVFSISVITYILATLVMWAIDVPEPYLGALIPTLGYFLSTQSMIQIKRWWTNKKRQLEGKK